MSVPSRLSMVGDRWKGMPGQGEREKVEWGPGSSDACLYRPRIEEILYPPVCRAPKRRAPLIMAPIVPALPLRRRVCWR